MYQGKPTLIIFLGRYVEDLIRTKSIYDSIDEADGRRILITRYYPRFCKDLGYDEWLRELSPSGDLLRKYHNSKITWTAFQKAFRKELNFRNAGEVIDRLAQCAKTGNVTILCYEREGQNCHRQIVADTILHRMRKIRNRESKKK
jgi:uncharacterized protein YeaO (DUF488 family)